MLSSLKELSKETKEPVNTSIDKKGALHARRTLRTLVNVGGTNKKSKSIGVQRLIEKYTGLRKLHRKEGVSVSTFNHRKARKDQISEKVRTTVKEFYTSRDFNKGRHPAICRRFKRVKSPVRLLETKIFFH